MQTPKNLINKITAILQDLNKLRELEKLVKEAENNTDIRSTIVAAFDRLPCGSEKERNETEEELERVLEIWDNIKD